MFLQANTCTGLDKFLFFIHILPLLFNLLGYRAKCRVSLILLSFTAPFTPGKLKFHLLNEIGKIGRASTTKLCCV